MPPLDLYLNKRLADFESRLQLPVLQSGEGPEAPTTTAGHLITEACNRVYRRFRRRRRGPGQRLRPYPQGPTAVEQAARIATQWASQRWETGKLKDRKLDTDGVVELAWQAR